jgi:hypothetical protein
VTISVRGAEPKPSPAAAARSRLVASALIKVASGMRARTSNLLLGEINAEEPTS